MEAKFRTRGDFWSHPKKTADEGQFRVGQRYPHLSHNRVSDAYSRAAHWRLLPDHYYDGGISGGSLDRPDLQRLLTEIRAGRVDNVVVYKVDRLTRSLTDFAKM